MTARWSIAVSALAGLALACGTANPETEDTTMNTSQNETTLDLRETRVFDAPVARVWRAWADADDVREWWGPHGFTVPVADMDFREGGSSFVCMRAPEEYGGTLHCNTWTYTAIEPQRRLEFVLHFTDDNRNRLDPAAMPGMPPGIPAEVPHEITFRALDGDRTELTIVEYGYTTDQAREQSKAGLDQVLEKLAVRVTPPRTD